MEKINLVMVGAEGVVESGGIINKVSCLIYQVLCQCCVNATHWVETVLKHQEKKLKISLMIFFGIKYSAHSVNGISLWTSVET